MRRKMRKKRSPKNELDERDVPHLDYRRIGCGGRPCTNRWGQNLERRHGGAQCAPQKK